MGRHLRTAFAPHQRRSLGVLPMNEALHAFLCHRGDARVLARRAQGVQARLLEASLLLCSRDLRDFEAAGWIYSRLKNERNEHVDALADAIDSELARACRITIQILAEEPLELLALV